SSLLSGPASLLTGVSVSGGGGTSVSDLHSTLDADLSGLTTSSVVASFAGTGTFTGDLGEAIITVSGTNVMILLGATMGTSSFVVEVSSLLSGPASLLTGVSVSGDGGTSVSDLHLTLDADLSALTTILVVAYFKGTATFTGDLGKARVTVTDSNTMTLFSTIMGTSSFVVKSGSTLAGPVDIYVTATNDISAATPAFAAVPFKADTGYVSLAEGTYFVTVTPAGSKTAAIGPLSLDLEANKIYTAVARDGVGLTDNVGLILLDDFN
ncbi:MAG: DUF4397 domain-containing protein, partial [Alishewanella sp.]|nr:DUF4397 domain-containing protein [Alishewanella sp.]